MRENADALTAVRMGNWDAKEENSQGADSQIQAQCLGLRAGPGPR